MKGTSSIRTSEHLKEAGVSAGHQAVAIFGSCDIVDTLVQPLIECTQVQRSRDELCNLGKLDGR